MQRAKGWDTLPSAAPNGLAAPSSMTEASGPQDNWTAVREKAERRKIQNRLNVRAHRKRKALETGRIIENLLAPRRRHPRVVPVCHGGRIATDYLLPSSFEMEQKQDQKMRMDILSHFRSNKGLDELRIRFPFSRDHLIPLIQFNALRAVFTNVHLLYQFNILFAPFPICNHNGMLLPTVETFDAPWPNTKAPETLQPTLLQQTVPHAPWIETLPVPRMRDNAILAGDAVDIREFQSDCFGALCPHNGRDNPGGNGVLAWSDPWHPRGWELTEGFAKKWKILLEGCEEIIEYTNYWRSLRDEEPLKWKDL